MSISSISKTRLRRLVYSAYIVGIFLATVGLLLTLIFLCWEASWVDEKIIEKPQEAYAHGSIGTEIMPLPVAVVLPEMFPQHFQPAGTDKGDWIEQFGFIRRNDPAIAGLDEFFQDADPDLKQFPVGFAVSNYRPGSAAPSPVKFVGFACILCHSTTIQEQGQKPHFVVGPGNASLNLFAWRDALVASVLDEEHLTFDAIKKAYHEKTQQSISATQGVMIRLWLSGFRQRIKEGLPRFDEPFGNGLSRRPEAIPTGPGRTQPFTTIVRNVLMRPGTSMAVYTKVAPNYHEDLRQWAQVDGSISDLDIRSALAAVAAGATIYNLDKDEITNNIRKSSDFTRRLAGPKWNDIFANHPIDAEAAARGRDVYMQHCDRCHGHFEGVQLVKGERYGEVIPYEEIGTDPERVTFRHFKEIPDALTALFPEHHPFRFERKILRPGPLGQTQGYINSEISSVFTRAPYLHNASVPTLAQLIHLEPRPAKFYRGRNYYDPVQVGLAAPAEATDTAYFPFDTTARGNSNAGHDYPWPAEEAADHRDELQDLLEYLKSI